FGQRATSAMAARTIAQFPSTEAQPRTSWKESRSAISSRETRSRHSSLPSAVCRSTKASLIPPSSGGRHGERALSMLGRRVVRSPMPREVARRGAAAASVVAAHGLDERAALRPGRERFRQARVEDELAQHAAAEQERLDHRLLLGEARETRL